MSCAARERLRTMRPNATSGSTMTGIAPSTKADRRALVTTIIAVEPKNSTRLRSAVEAEAPTAALIWVVSAVSRDTNSPDFAVSKNAADRMVIRSNTASRRSATTRSPMLLTR